MVMPSININLEFPEEIYCFAYARIQIYKAVAELARQELFGTKPCCADWGTLYRLYAAKKYVESHLLHTSNCDLANAWNSADQNTYVIGTWVQHNGSCFMAIKDLTTQVDIWEPGVTPGWNVVWKVAGTPTYGYTGLDCVALYLCKKTKRIYDT